MQNGLFCHFVRDWFVAWSVDRGGIIMTHIGMSTIFCYGKEHVVLLSVAAPAAKSNDANNEENDAFQAQNHKTRKPGKTRDSPIPLGAAVASSANRAGNLRGGNLRGRGNLRGQSKGRAI
jgi:hypothetical protein